MFSVRGFVLLPVMLTLTLIAAVVLVITLEGPLNAHWVADQNEASQARYLAAAGMAHATWLKDNSGCIGDINLAATPFGSHSYTATVATAASTTSYNFSPDQDTEIQEANADTPFGSATELSVKQATGDSHRALYHFDVSSLAAGSRVAGATLWLYATANDDLADVGIHPVTAAWSQGSATWNTVASSFESAQFATVPLQQQPNVWVQVNLTPLAQAWVNDPAGNNGIMLIARSTNKESRYTSQDYGNAGLRPYLEVITADADVSPVAITATGTLANGVARTLNHSGVKTYQAPNTLTLQPDAAAGKDTWISEWKATWNYGKDESLTVDGDGTLKHGLLQFDLGAIPIGAKVLNAILDLYQNNASSSGGAVEIRRVLSNWAEGAQWASTGAANWTERETGVPWVVSGGDYSPFTFASTTLPAGVVGWFEWDVTSLVGDWVAGTYNNDGLALMGGGSGDDFTSSDGNDSSLHPKLTVTYACECGSACVAPQGSGKVVMVVADDMSLPAEDAATKSILESWGYTVSLIADDANQPDFDNAAANNDVFYVTETVLHWDLGTRLRDTPIGVVYEQGLLNDEFGLASGGAWPVGDAIHIVDATHDITRVFPAGSLAIKTARTEILTVGGSTAPGLQTLADFGGVGSLAVLDVGAELEGGGTAAGRRVMLPLGGNAQYNWQYLNSNGRLMVHRALQWAGEDTGGGCAGTVRDEFNAQGYAGSDGTLNWANDWVEIGEADGATAGDVQVLNDQSNYQLRVRNSNTGLEREADLSGYTTATLALEYRRQQLDKNNEYVQIEISANGGGSWTELGRLSRGVDSDYQALSYDISGYLAANTRLRFVASSTVDADDVVFFDNVEICVGP